MTDAGDALAPGTRLEEFRIERVLGAGGFGVTYLARDLSLDTWRAVKEYLPRDWGTRRRGGMIGPRTNGDAEDYRWGLERFLEEARILARFKHPHIVQVYRVFEARGTAYMVTEHVEGRTLASELRASGPLPEARVRSLLEALTEGLSAVHAAGLLHRDIKPGNVMVGRDGTPILIDFGSARQAMGRHSRSVTAVLTPGYAPIEQYSSRGRQGPWTDIYALGAVAYRALSGEVPEDATERVRHDPLRPLAQASSSRVSRSLADAVDAALSVHEEDRPQSLSAWRSLWQGGPAVPSDDSAAAGVPLRSAISALVHRRSAPRATASSRSLTSGPPAGGGRDEPTGSSLAARVNQLRFVAAVCGASLAIALLIALGLWSSAQLSAERDVRVRQQAERARSSRDAPVASRVQAGTGGGGERVEPEDEPAAPRAGAAVASRQGGSAAAAAGPAAVEAALGLDRSGRRLIQQGLTASGFDPGTADGRFGPGTRAALRAWQSARRMPATGYLNASGAAALRSAGEEAVRLAGERRTRAAQELSALLGREPSASHQDGNGWTDLHYAAILNLPYLVTHLLDEGANVNARLRDDQAVIGGLVPPTLLRKGYNLRGWTRDGETPLHLAAWANSREAIEQLAARGAALEAKTAYGWTPLHYAAVNKATGAMQTLTSAGANPQARNSEGETPNQILARVR